MEGLKVIMMGVAVLSLFEEKIDEEKTAEKVKDFFNDDFQTYLNFSGTNRFNLSSPVLDPTGISGSHGQNHQEDRQVVNLSAELAVKAITDAINNCTNTARKPYATLLYLRYVQEMFDWQVYSKLHCSKTQYYRLRNKAFIEFAQRLTYWKGKDGASDIPDLIIYA